MKSLQDHFSAGSGRYARYRPTYPAELFAFLASLVPEPRHAWDCGTGNGQAAIGLAERFTRVIASDASKNQLAHRRDHDRVAYLACRAETSPLAVASMDLVVAAQALHWFDIEGFYTEVRRVARPHGLLAVWCYTLCGVTPAVDAIVRRYYYEVVGPYWPEQRQLTERRYRTIPFPFAELSVPAFEMRADWSLADLTGYFSTWSPARLYRRAVGRDPLDEVRGELRAAWGDPEGRRRVIWPLHLRVGRI